MDDNELISIFDKSYKTEYAHYFQQLDPIYEPARDKLYATELALSIVSVIYGFRSSSALDKSIIDTFDFSYKLGGSIPEIICNIPELINKENINDNNLHRRKHKSKVSLDFEYLWGFIPYKFKGFKIKGGIRIRPGSAFSSLTTEEEIADCLGRQRAIIDLREELITRFISLGGDPNLFKDRVRNNSFGYLKLQTIDNIRAALSVNHLDTFFKILQSGFASLPYNTNAREAYFHRHIHFILELIGIKVESEISTNMGRIDTVIETDNYIYIIEYKQSTADIALKQILDNKYPQRYHNDRKKIIIVGVSVDNKTKNISDWKVQEYDYNF